MYMHVYARSTLKPFMKLPMRWESIVTLSVVVDSRSTAAGTSIGSTIPQIDLILSVGFQPFFDPYGW